MERKRLYRNVNDKMLCGVCSGLADYFNIDPTLVRLAWVLLGFMGGSGLLAYIIIYISNTDISAGDTPDILEACPIDTGLYSFNF